MYCDILGGKKNEFQFEYFMRANFYLRYSTGVYCRKLGGWVSPFVDYF
jgi:hypothetical protein